MKLKNILLLKEVKKVSDNGKIVINDSLDEFVEMPPGSVEQTVRTLEEQGLLPDISVRGLKEKLSSKVDKIIYHEKNLGKGACIKTGLKHVTGEVVIIQDADLEYDPNEYKKLIKPILEFKADIVYGSRFVGSEGKRTLYFWNRVANYILTTFSNMCTNINLTDMETGFKCFRTSAIKSINLKENGFGFEPEVTAKLANKNKPMIKTVMGAVQSR